MVNVWVMIYISYTCIHKDCPSCPIIEHALSLFVFFPSVTLYGFVLWSYTMDFSYLLLSHFHRLVFSTVRYFLSPHGLYSCLLAANKNGVRLDRHKRIKMSEYILLLLVINVVDRDFANL
jgi:hypothetical protein